VQRASHAGWWSPKERPDPVATLAKSNEGRIPGLIPIRFGRMSQSPFAFYRGAAAVMAADLAKTPASGIRVQACGDAHLMNFGGFATPERNVVFDGHARVPVSQAGGDGRRDAQDQGRAAADLWRG
jgi:hypothetical protein